MFKFKKRLRNEHKYYDLVKQRNPAITVNKKIARQESAVKPEKPRHRNVLAYTIHSNIQQTHYIASNAAVDLREKTRLEKKVRDLRTRLKSHVFRICRLLYKNFCQGVQTFMDKVNVKMDLSSGLKMKNVLCGS